MRYFLDTEFIEDGVTIDLISIGFVCEDGREYYAANRECDLSKSSRWVRDNVLIPMGCVENPTKSFVMRPVDPLVWKSRQQIKEDILFLVYGSDGRPAIEGCLDTDPEFWAYYADYDWVVFCQLFGTMMDLPKGFPMYCRDIKQECDRLGNPQLPAQEEGAHNALEDARWNRKVWEFLRAMEATQ